MQTHLADNLLDPVLRDQMEAILRNCVHCGFCTATCPTYLKTGNELDSPRGRVYQIKTLFETGKATRSIQVHLDRCLSCYNCETTCPSGIIYRDLVAAAREFLDEKQPRPWREKIIHKLLLAIVPYRKRFALMLKTGQFFRPFLPKSLREKVPARVEVKQDQQARSKAKQSKQPVQERWLLHKGCAQESLTPNTHAALYRIASQLQIKLVEIKEAGCCGALVHHLGKREPTKQQIRQNLDAWSPLLESSEKPIQGLIVADSGCGSMIEEYGKILKNEPKNDLNYAERAQKLSENCIDPIEFLEKYQDRLIRHKAAPTRIAFHPPCSLQHGLKIKGRVEALLTKLGFELTLVQDSHLCCGSAGSYAVLQPELSEKLRDSKQKNLLADDPVWIATSNVGCIHHLREGLDRPVVHWLELVDVKA